MTIKKQFIILSSIIIAIPLLCSIFVIFFSYLHSPKRYMMKGSQRLELIESKDDALYIKKTIRQLPTEVQMLVFSPEQNRIIFSTIPELPADDSCTSEFLWKTINNTSDSFFYQFSTPPLKDTKLLLITRLPHKKNGSNKRLEIYTVIFVLLLFYTIISMILITLISRTIFNSIIKIENKTQQLADGNLNEKINSETVETGNEITSILNSLEKMRHELVEIQERKNRFIMGISHDLRTPVAVIKGYSEAISDGVISDEKEIKNTIGLIDKKTTQLGEMIDTLINFMKLNNSEAKQTLIPQSITELINDFGKYALVTGTVFKRKVTTDIVFNENIIVPLNEQLVIRSLENLFSNAIRYTNDNDKIEIYSRIEKSAEKKSGNAVILKIKDSGTGINKKDLNSIFDMFFRGTNSRLEEGMGIGLSVVKTIMDTHGWKIGVESEKNKGSCFTITIPIKTN